MGAGASCDGGHWGNSQDWGKCTCAVNPLPAPLWMNVGFFGMLEQEDFENNPSYAYNTKILDPDDTWRPTSTDPTTAAMAASLTTKFKTINYVGTISARCLAEIQQSVSLSARFSLQDSSTIGYQIRISSTPPNRLYMSPDASALPEFVSVNKDGNVIITPANNYHNNM